MTFDAVLAAQTSEPVVTRLVRFNEDALMPGEVRVAVEYSTGNDHHAMMVSGGGPIIRHLPLIPGVDLAGVVEASRDAGSAVSDRVLTSGRGLHQPHSGGDARKVQGRMVVEMNA
ncbi:alcohol dehydrogenase catalytic domain-containing protein [Xanthomonas arboricola]|uniref:alcohol dehydrogenase catalytic domain-containing protein n=1 Tax=Xanthomonas arboricola TaxID=56448 RepID=UPI003EB7FD59